ncbi:MAG TPA: hypothetical protein VGO58_12265 [Chitinophagaceae bacterium]|jgi:hypothetical protein|nr:hypothetical protein [Chitinophagaceae bacterium]
MINSYPASLITITAAVTEACLLHTKKQWGIIKHKKSKVSKFLKLNDKQIHLKTGVGIKFDNILARKYFVLIQSAQALGKTIEK